MATTSEHDVDPEPFSPSVFLDLPPTPHPQPDGDSEDMQQASSDDMVVLPFIRRMLLEEDEEDTDEYPDHPALLLAQQPFAQILSAVATHSASGSWATNDANATWPYDPVQLSQQLLWRTRPGGTGVVGLDGFTGAGANAFHSSPGQGSSGASMCGPNQAGSFFSGGDTAIKSSSSGHGVTMEMLNLAFLKGMEEANRFLPTNNGRGLLNSNQKRPLSQVQVEMGAETSRNSKLMAPEPEETGEIVDQAAHNLLSSCLKDIESLRITVGDNKNTRKKKKQQQQQPAPEAGDLHTLLLLCAEAVGMNDRRSATQLLRQIRTHSSPTGDANQRLAHCFAQGLEARLAGTGSQLYRPLVSRRTSVVEYFKAYQLYVDTCCFKIMLFRFSNITIRNAAMGRKKLHIVDYGIGYGLQWPVLLRRLGTFEGGPPEVRITGIDLPQPGFRPSSRIEQTGRRLSSYASQFGVPFKFRGITAKWETIRVDDLDIEPDEVLIVNSIASQFGYSMDDGVTVDTPSPRDVVLKNIRKMNPHVFILCIVNATYNSPFFVTRFREALSYYSKIFDMLDATTPRDNELRLLVEDLYGQGALNVVACEGLDRVERPETYKKWQVRNHRAGLRQLPLDPCTIEDIRERVQSLYHKDFVIDMDQQWVLQGWKGRILYAMSTWVANESA